MDIVIVGGGASGLIAAIRVKELRPEFRVTILERLNRTGKKLLTTGNGRCNLTNQGAAVDDYHGDLSILYPAMEVYTPIHVMEYFKKIGVYPKIEKDGKVYPMSEQASSVLDALRMALAERNAIECVDFEVHTIRRTRHGFELLSSAGESVHANRVLIATGGLTAPNLGGSASGHRLLQSLGHTITPCYPSIVQLKTSVEPIRALKGLKYTGHISILVEGTTRRTEWGEVLFTEYGLSGPPVLQLSRIASVEIAKRKSVCVALQILDWGKDRIFQELLCRRTCLSTRPVENFLTGMINKRIGQTLIKHAGILPASRTCESLTDGELHALSGLLEEWMLPVTGTQSFEHAQVTAGGAKADEFTPQTLESRIVPGLFAAGEVLDVDGDCGGYNLQWAWASGLFAADSMVQ